MDISVVVPVYGCRACLEDLYRRLVAALTEITQSFEIILVDDACCSIAQSAGVVAFFTRR